MKFPRLFAFLFFSLVFFGVAVSDPAEASEELELPVLCVEMDGFGFRGDFHRIRFEKGFEKAWEERSLPYQLEFKSFPVKDYKGMPAIELRLNYWRSWHPGQRMINFWATYVAPDGKKHKLDIIQYEGDAEISLSSAAMERSFEENAYEASQLLLEKVTPFFEQN